jgi:hypothetical protein
MGSGVYVRNGKTKLLEEGRVANHPAFSLLLRNFLFP